MSHLWSSPNTLVSAILISIGSLFFVWASLDDPLWTSWRGDPEKSCSSSQSSQFGRAMKICFSPIHADLPILHAKDQTSAEIAAEEGFGPSDKAEDPHVRQTHMYSLHVLLRNGLRKSALYVSDCHKADAVLVMYDVGLHKLWQPRPRIFRAIEANFWGNRTTYLPHIKKKLHILPISRVELEFRDCPTGNFYGTSFLCPPESFENIVYPTIEKRWDPPGSHPHALEVPYPAKIAFQRRLAVPDRLRGQRSACFWNMVGTRDRDSHNCASSVPKPNG